MATQSLEEFNVRYGAAIRQLRRDRGLTQSDINGLSAYQIRRIEKGECRASYRIIKLLATSHGIEGGEYMNELAERLAPKPIRPGAFLNLREDDSPPPIVFGSTSDNPGADGLVRVMMKGNVELVDRLEYYRKREVFREMNGN